MFHKISREKHGVKKIATFCQTDEGYKDQFESNRERNRYLHDVEKKLRKVQERLLT